MHSAMRLLPSARRPLVHQILITGAVLALCLPFTQANAQVHRCTNTDGATVYTDAACPAGFQAVEIEAAKSPEEVAADKQRAEDARQLQAQQRLQWQEERRLKAETDALEASAKASAAAEAASRAQAFNYAETAACREAMRQLDRVRTINGSFSSNDLNRQYEAQDAADRACLSPQDYANLQRDRNTRPTTTIVVVPPVYPQQGQLARPSTGNPTSLLPHTPSAPPEVRPRPPHRPDRPPHVKPNPPEKPVEVTPKPAASSAVSVTPVKRATPHITSDTERK
ncbi:DUF4124 domain-containing protein [Lampropedia puyangensis]|uniref:DUF4124 domain-containing protein n=1 Tax=Lampropedia puyangensis TaxID=1330072 RepID=A0A4S8EYJ9_9BURK|nr:DUF4124 domain-containing protein [Lampropedia puyangensis]THT99676.1 DUF4124 domain-containing protein [Lampropedia puyangensis]